MIDRQRLEQIESETLAPYALLSRASRGRQYPDHEPSYRTAFQRDRDRIIHAAAFRRLEYKTQVFVNDEGDYYRTRLTHTLEVAQIGRTLARALAVNEDLVETLCLAHDLGHPPFGHSGENVLNRLMQDHGGFNHNRQTYRIVTQLERRYPEWPGLNLTYETLEGIAQHAPDTELNAVTGYEASLRGSLEAQIANLADDLAYNAHDLDDGLQSGLITPDDLREIEIWGILCERIEWSGSVMDELTRHRCVRELIGMEVDDVLQQTLSNLSRYEPQSSRDVQNAPVDLVSHGDTMLTMNLALKKFLFEHMYSHFRVIRMAKRAELYINQIFESYVNEPRQLPPEYQAQIADSDVYRVVADYIASMTDRSALLEYQRLFDPSTRP